jgi:serine/threonine protein kinase
VSGSLSEKTKKRDTVIGTPFFLAPEIIQEVGYDFKASFLLFFFFSFSFFGS